MTFSIAILMVLHYLKTKNDTDLYPCRSVSIGLSTRWQMPKNEVIFCEIVFVAVRWYCRERFRKKQEMARKTRCFPCHFFKIIYADSRGRLSLRKVNFIFLLAIEQLFRQSETRIISVSLFLLIIYNLYPG